MTLCVSAALNADAEMLATSVQHDTTDVGANKVSRPHPFSDLEPKAIDACFPMSVAQMNHGNTMATLFLICGLPGAGKTTLARQIEQDQPAVRLSPDEWIVGILADVTDIAERDRLRDPVEALQWQLAKRLLSLGDDVILENGFWSRTERDSYRSQAEALGARVVLHYLAVERDELWRRLSKRNVQLPPGTFAVTEEELDRWLGWFEPPAADELAPP